MGGDTPVNKPQDTGTDAGRYALLELLEAGVSGRLYKARDTQQNATVLMKVVSRAVSSDPQFRRYLYDRWAERANLFDHPNIARVVEVGKRGPQYYAVIEEIPGKRLSERAGDAPLDYNEVVEIVRQIAEALRAAHRRGVVHGHLKPSDVFITEDDAGQMLVKVLFLDLGIKAANSILCLFGNVCGPPQYMAPEVIKGDMPEPPSDLFALGVIAYQLLTGSDPFPSAHPIGYLFGNCETPLVPAHEARESVPVELSRVVCRCLEKDPTQRYQDAQRLIDDLDRCAKAVNTGHVSVVPMGSDSAFAREYEIAPAGGAGPGAPRWARPVAWVALALVVGCLAGLLVQGLRNRAGDGSPAPSGDARNEHAVVTTQQRVGATDQLTPGGSGEQQPDPRELAGDARAQYERALDDWDKHYRHVGNYGDAETAFKAVADRYPTTSAANDAREMAAQINCEWAASLMRNEDPQKRDFETAEARYRQAVALAPEGSHWRRRAMLQLPELIADWADNCEGRGAYDKALELYATLEKEFPGTVQAELRKHREPMICYYQAFSLWKDREQRQEALEKFLYVIQNYPDTPAAKQCREKVPLLYLDMARAKFKAGQLRDAQQELATLREAFPKGRVAQEAADLEAEVLYRLFEQAYETGKPKEAAAWYGTMATHHPASDLTQLAARRRLGLLPEKSEVMFAPATARNMYAEAERLYAEMDYVGAKTKFRSLIRYTEPSSPTGKQALARLPEVAYCGALNTYGWRNPKKCRTALGGVVERYPHSEWAAKATGALQAMDATPQGMVFVPEGRFYMGASLGKIRRFLTPFYQPPDHILLTGEAERNLLFDMLGFNSEIPEHLASTRAFYIDRTEVTNLQYGKFVDEIGHAPPLAWQGGTFPKGEENRPVTGVSYEDALTYAKWAGKRLPTEAEWEKAARGVEGRLYPWGNVYNQDACHHMRPYDAGPVDVGSYPAGASPYGCVDMIGNVLEWTQGRFTAYPGDQAQGRREVFDPNLRVLRGGAWVQHDKKPIPIRCSHRFQVAPETTHFYRPGDTGFRCVKDVE